MFAFEVIAKPPFAHSLSKYWIVMILYDAHLDIISRRAHHSCSLKRLTPTQLPQLCYFLEDPCMLPSGRSQW